LKNKCSVWKRIKFPTFWYNCYYFTWSDTYFIQLQTLLINHPSYHVAFLSFRAFCQDVLWITDPDALACFPSPQWGGDSRWLNLQKLWRHIP